MRGIVRRQMPRPDPYATSPSIGRRSRTPSRTTPRRSTATCTSTTGEVLRVVDGVADPQMHVRIASDGNYLRVDPVSSREQYRWMERFIPMVDETELRGKLAQAIDGKGAFRRFKDVLMSFATERERWFAFRSERLRTFMEAWLNAHAIQAIARPAWADDAPAPEAEPAPESTEETAPKSQSGRRARNAEACASRSRSSRTRSVRATST